MTVTTESETAPAPEPPKKKRSWIKWTLLTILIGFLVVVLLIGGLIGFKLLQVPHDKLDPVKPGSLSTANSQVTGTSTLGPYKVIVASDNGTSLTVQNAASGAVVWRNDPGHSFLSSSQGSFSTIDSFGIFWADISRETTLTDQVIKAVAVTPTAVTVTGDLTNSSGASAPFTFALTTRQENASPTTLGLSAKVGSNSNGKPATSVVLSSGRDSGEQVHGFGEQYASYDLPAEAWAVMIGEQGLGRGAQPETVMADLTHWAGGNGGTTYAAWPQYITSANRAVTLDQVPGSNALGVIDLRDPKTINYELWSPELHAEAVAGTSPTDLIVTRDAGTTRPKLADWVQDGAVLGLQGGTTRVRGIVDQMLAAGTKVSGVWLQDWVGPRTTSFGQRLWWTWQLDQATYPDWDQMVKYFNSKGIRVLNYVNTYVVKTDVPGAPKVKSLYNEAEQKGYLVKQQNGQVYLLDQNGFDAAIVDLTNPAAQNWYADVIAKDVLGIGTDGFMADFGEDLPYDAVVHTGNANDGHGGWPTMWAKTVQKGCAKAGKPECVAWFRSGSLGMGEHMPIGWNGDQTVDYDKYDGMASALLGSFSEGVSGVPLTHSDSGGYTSINVYLKNYVRPPNLNQRWAEMEAFGPMLRTHETNLPSANQQVYSTPQTAAAFAHSSKIFAALAPYRKTVTAEANATGLPAIRHTSMMFPGTDAASYDFQLMFGAHVLMAPVFSDKATEVEVHFPPGQWVSIFTGQTYQGDSVTKVPSPLGTPAAFVQVGDPVGTQVRDAIAKAGLSTAP